MAPLFCGAETRSVRCDREGRLTKPRTSFQPLPSNRSTYAHPGCSSFQTIPSTSPTSLLSSFSALSTSSLLLTSPSALSATSLSHSTSFIARTASSLPRSAMSTRPARARQSASVDSRRAYIWTDWSRASARRCSSSWRRARRATSLRGGGGEMGATVGTTSGIKRDNGGSGWGGG